MLKVKISRTLASGFGSGFAPVISGTFGTAAALIPWAILRYYYPQPSLLIDLLVIALVIIVGIAATEICLKHPIVAGNKRSNVEDPGYIVIDEWAGIFITLLMVPAKPLLYPFLGFVLFRLFDIIKPGPVRAAEKLPGGLGVMMDDVLAGIFAAVVLCAIRFFA